MSDHANDITVGEVNDCKVVITVYGPLANYLQGLRRFVVTADGVRDAFEVAGKPIIHATVVRISKDDTDWQIRIRIRNRCRDWVHATTGLLTNVGIQGTYVDLIEEAPVAG